MGIAFAELFVPFLAEREIEVRNVTKIARNPEQSKHLETCKATLMGMEIDFVNLRSEEYALDSRIPTKVVSTFRLCFSWGDWADADDCL